MHEFTRGDLFTIKSNVKSLPLQEEFDSPLIFWEFLYEKPVMYSASRTSEVTSIVKVVVPKLGIHTLQILYSDTVNILVKASEII